MNNKDYESMRVRFLTGKKSSRSRRPFTRAVWDKWLQRHNELKNLEYQQVDLRGHKVR